MVIRRKRRADEESELCRYEHGEGQGNPTTRYFDGIKALFISEGVSPKRLRIWKEKVQTLGGYVAEPCNGAKKRFTHVLAKDPKFLKQHNFRCSNGVLVLKFEWIEDCLKEGKVLPHDLYFLKETASASKGLAITGVANLNNSRAELHRDSEKSLPCEQDTELQNHPNEDSNHVESGIDREVLGSRSERVELCGMGVYERESCPEEEDGYGQSTVDTHMSGDIPCLNRHISSILREMWDIYESVLGDEWRALTYRKAAIQLERLSCKITCMEDIKHMYGIGSSMADKIKEILCTGKLQKLENLKTDSKVRTLQHLASIWGVGPKLAQKLYQAGHRSVNDLVKDLSLSQMARLGVKYYKDLALRIPRDEAAAAEKYAQELGEYLCPGICISVAGSYRRRSSTCGDIDFLVTHPDGYSHRGFLTKLVEKLQSTGFITEGLHCTDHMSEGIKKVDTFMGVGQVPGYQHIRRLDIKVYPKETYAFALVYFTGNDVLNRKIRYAAQRKGFKLNDQGLYRRYGGKKGLSSTESILCATEEEVFSMIGFPYLEPCDRNL